MKITHHWTRGSDSLCPAAGIRGIEITQEAYMGLEAEAVLKGMTLKKLASQLILENISERALQFVNAASQDGEMEDDPASEPEDDEQVKLRISRPRISDNAEAMKRSKFSGLRTPGPHRGRLPRSSAILHRPPNIRSRTCW